MLKKKGRFLHKRTFKNSIIRVLKRKLITDDTNSSIYESSHTQVTNDIHTPIPVNEQEKYSSWCLLFIDGATVEAKIFHKGRGKFKIVNDKYGGIYINKIVDASDIVHCKVEI